MKYDDLIKELKEYADILSEGGEDYLVSLLYDAADSIKELQSTVVIVNIEENKDGVSNT